MREPDLHRGPISSAAHNEVREIEAELGPELGSGETCHPGHEADDARPIVGLMYGIPLSIGLWVIIIAGLMLFS